MMQKDHTLSFERTKLHLLADYQVNSEMVNSPNNPQGKRYYQGKCDELVDLARTLLGIDLREEYKSQWGASKVAMKNRFFGLHVSGFENSFENANIATRADANAYVKDRDRELDYCHNHSSLLPWMMKYYSKLDNPVDRQRCKLSSSDLDDLEAWILANFSDTRDHDLTFVRACRAGLETGKSVYLGSAVDTSTITPTWWVVCIYSTKGC